MKLKMKKSMEVIKQDLDYAIKNKLVTKILNIKVKLEMLFLSKENLLHEIVGENIDGFMEGNLTFTIFQRI